MSAGSTCYIQSSLVLFCLLRFSLNETLYFGQHSLAPRALRYRNTSVPSPCIEHRDNSPWSTNKLQKSNNISKFLISYLEVPGVHASHGQVVASHLDVVHGAGDPVLHHAVHLLPGDAAPEVRHPHRHVLLTFGNWSRLLEHFKSFNRKKPRAGNIECPSITLKLKALLI